MSILPTGQRVRILPNDFIDADLGAEVMLKDISQRAVLLKLAAPLNYAGAHYSHAIARLRLEGQSWDLQNGNTIGVAVTWITTAQFDPGHPFNLSWWRGGAAAITDIVLD